MAKRQPSVTTNTPKVTFIYCYVSRPDTKYGKYKTQGHFQSKEDAMEVVDKIKEVITKAGKKPGKVTWEGTTRQSKCERMLIGGIKTKIYKTTEDTYYIDSSTDYVPEIFNVKGDLYPEDQVPIVGNGSTGKIKVGLSYNDEHGTVSAHLKGLQVIGFTRVGGFDDASDEVEEGEIVEAIATQKERSFDDDDDGDDEDNASDDSDSEDDDNDEDQDW